MKCHLFGKAECQSIVLFHKKLCCVERGRPWSFLNFSVKFLWAAVYACFFCFLKQSLPYACPSKMRMEQRLRSRGCGLWKVSGTHPERLWCVLNVVGVIPKETQDLWPPKDAGLQTLSAQPGPVIDRVHAGILAPLGSTHSTNYPKLLHPMGFSSPSFSFL